MGMAPSSSRYQALKGGTSGGGSSGGGMEGSTVALKDVRTIERDGTQVTPQVTIDDHEVVRALKRVKHKISKDVIEEAVLEGAEIIREDMEARAPEGETGELQDNIVKEVLDSSSTSAKVGVAPDREHFYGKFVELGAKGGPDKEPFMRPAFDENKHKARKVIADGLWEAIEEVTE